MKITEKTLNEIIKSFEIKFELKLKCLSNQYFDCIFFDCKDKTFEIANRFHTQEKKYLWNLNINELTDLYSFLSIQSEKYKKIKRKNKMEFIQDNKNSDKGIIIIDGEHWSHYFNCEKLFNSKGEWIYLKIINDYNRVNLYIVENGIVDLNKTA